VLFDYHPGIRVLLPTPEGVRSIRIKDLMPLGAVWTPEEGTGGFDANVFEYPPEGQQMSMFGSVEASSAERQPSRPGDTVVAPADVVMDRAVTVDASTEWSGHGCCSSASSGQADPRPRHRAIYVTSCWPGQQGNCWTW
jgi:hypothetical protein